MKHLHLPDRDGRCGQCGAPLVYVPPTPKRAGYYRPRRQR